jgi:hypothetical protein
MENTSDATNVEISWSALCVAHVTDWLSPYPYPRINSSPWLGSIFPYRVRLLHPAYDHAWNPVTWSSIADAQCMDLTPETQFSDLTRSNDPNAVVAGVFYASPSMGILPEEWTSLLDTLLGRTTDYGLVWTGYGLLGGMLATAPIVSNAQLSYWGVEAKRGDSVVTSTYKTPNFFWPRDHNWCVGTGIDSRDTFVAANNIEILERLVSNPAIETICVA